MSAFVPSCHARDLGLGGFVVDSDLSITINFVSYDLSYN